MGDYVDLKFMPGLKMSRISIDIPIEDSNVFLEAFKAPDRVNPVKVAIARLDVEALMRREENSGVAQLVEHRPVKSAAEGSSPSPRATDRTYSLSQVAAMKCQDEAFGIWMASKYSATFDRYYYDAPGNVTTPEACNQTLKYVLGIQSKKQLDTDPHAAQAFSEMLASFDHRDTAR